MFGRALIVAPSIIVAVALAATGLAVGSFVGLLTIRLPAGLPWISGRSKCGGCGRSLTPGELVPVLSWVFAHGRCRTCSAPAPLRYPLLETGCATIGVWAGVLHAPSLAPATAAFGWWLVLIAVIDAEHFWLPRALTLPLIGAGLAIHLAGAPPSLLDSVAGAAIGWAVLALLAALYRVLRGRQGLGGGDPPMLAAVGAWVGWQGLAPAVLLACGAGLALATVQGRLRVGTKLPLGTLLALGGWLAWLYGPAGDQAALTGAFRASAPRAIAENVRGLRTLPGPLVNRIPDLLLWPAARALREAWPREQLHRAGPWGEDGRAD